MGAGNVKLVFARWADLPHGPFRVLVYMALRSMDDDKPPMFWGGREDLALAIGRIVPDEDTSNAEVTAARNAAFKAARDATTLLTKCGAISEVKGAAPGRRRTFMLNLEARTVHGKRAPTVHGKRAQQCTENVQTVHEERAPEEDEDPPGLKDDEPTDLRNARYRSARASGSDGPDPSTGTPGRACLSCEAALDPDGSCFVCRTPPTRRTA